MDALGQSKNIDLEEKCTSKKHEILFLERAVQEDWSMNLSCQDSL